MAVLYICIVIKGQRFLATSLRKVTPRRHAKGLTSGKRVFYFGKKALLLREGGN